MIKLKYIPGLRPSPMLAYYTDKNEKVYDELKEDMGLKETTKYHHGGDHYWNMNAYIIVEHHHIKSMVFVEFIYVIYLLRVINQEIILELPDDYMSLIENDLKDLVGEIEVIK